MKPYELLLLAGLLAGLAACPSSSDPSGGDDDDATEDVPQPAPLAELSDGECPELGSSGMSTFSSGGEDRLVGVFRPDGDTTDLPVLFFFHGLTTPGTDPVGNLASGLDLQGLADDMPAIIVAPEARPTPVPLAGNVLLWGILDDGGVDLQLYDDLRTCVVDELGADRRRVHAMGFSGGALWTSRMIMERSDTLASAVEFSGGVELDIPLDGGPFLTYQTPAETIPVLLSAGGETDVWPGGGFALIDFVAATDILQGGLRTDGHYVVRCDHSQGHTIVLDGWELGQRWVEEHFYGESSPFIDEGLGGDEAWCEVVGNGR